MTKNRPSAEEEGGSLSVDQARRRFHRGLRIRRRELHDRSRVDRWGYEPSEERGRGAPSAGGRGRPPNQSNRRGIKWEPMGMGDSEIIYGPEFVVEPPEFVVGVGPPFQWGLSDFTAAATVGAPVGRLRSVYRRRKLGRPTRGVR